MLSVLGAATTRLRLVTNIYLAALCEPFTVARAVATASALMVGRVVCGVSAEWLREKFEAAGVDFASRGRRRNKLLAVCGKLRTGDLVSHQGAHFSFPEVIMRPAPAGRITVWIGGTSAPALRRAAANGGLLDLTMTVADNVAIVGRMLAFRDELDLARDGVDSCVSPLEPLSGNAGAQLAEAGIANVTVIPWMPTPWDLEPYVHSNADVGRLDVKKTAISRFVDRAIVRQR